MQIGLWLSIVIAIALFAGLLAPYLFEELHRGKLELGPRLPTGAGDTMPGYSDNPTTGRPPQAPRDHTTLSLRSFHSVVILFSIVLAAGTGSWGLLNHEVLFGAVSLAVALLLVVYWSVFLTTAEDAHVE